MSSGDAVRIGLLGHGTVGGAFDELLAERADAVEAADRAPARDRRRPHPQRGRLRRDPRRLRPGRRADRRHRARPRVRRSPRCARGKPVVTANKQLLAQHGDELFAAAREAGVQLRFEAAVAGVIPIVRVIQESFGADRDLEGLRHRQRHDQLHPQRDGRDRRRLRRRRSPAPRSSATPRPTRPTTSTAPTPRRRWRSSPASPSTRRSPSTRSPTKGSRRSSPTTSPTPRSSASR